MIYFGIIWLARNKSGHTVWWWKDGDTWRMTARGYPTSAKELVIEVQVKARPSFKLRWGAKGWHGKDDGEHSWFVNLRGERILDALVSKAALDSEGLTEKVGGFLHAAGRLWRVIPLDAGRTLRFVDSCGKGVEVFWNGLDGVDLEEILSSVNCANYHRRMQEQARIHGIATAQAGEAMVKLGLTAPLDSLPLVHRLGKLEEAGLKLREALEQAWAELFLLLNALRVDMRSAGRPKTKLAAARRIELLVKFFHEHLPADHPFRANGDISQGTLVGIARLIAEEEAKLAPKEASGPGGAATEA